jgi:gluconolactonase
MTTSSHASAFRELLQEDARLEQLATGCVFTEGPIWNPDGGFLLFSDIPADARMRWDEDSGLAVAAAPANHCNGMTLDLDHRLIVCEHATNALVRMDPDGSGRGREVLATHYDGRELNSPNDVVVRSDGAIYFTDPNYGRRGVVGAQREQELPFQGVYRLPADGGEVQLLADDLGQPNGLCFSSDESLLYVDDTERAQIRVFDVTADGLLADGRVFADGVGTASMAAGDLLDGMKLDARGNLWITGPGGVCVFDPSGEQIGTVHAPEPVANLAWGGPDGTWLFLTATTSLYRLRCAVSGARTHLVRPSPTDAPPG